MLWVPQAVQLRVFRNLHKINAVGVEGGVIVVFNNLHEINVVGAISGAFTSG
jgi:hypothetical protein